MTFDLFSAMQKLQQHFGNKAEILVQYDEANRLYRVRINVFKGNEFHAGFLSGDRMWDRFYEAVRRIDYEIGFQSQRKP